MSKNNERYALLINYEFCTGCHSCETACKVENNLTHGQWGIKVAQDGPRKLENGKFEFIHVPIPTSLCNLCEDRVNKGKLPSCVQHCQAAVMSFGPVEELAEKISKPQMVIFTPV
ncbi:4Fe-4S binding protein [Dehalobacter sp. DCM]|uniref:4Fe-4S dicluster domain-containing protein n=1 Tax=Dehalobacter sp. DCM TaxID=2907827 RepID=UPI003081D045|nr:4Fe-4S binding protein [Dehalobacter sp. DCM]